MEDVRDTLARWDALGSRDLSSREAAMEVISQEVLRRAEGIGPISPGASTCPSHTGDLNDMLARILMLAKRCPFGDVREKCAWILQNVQVTFTCQCQCMKLYILFIVLFIYLMCQDVHSPHISAL